MKKNTRIIIITFTLLIASSMLLMSPVSTKAAAFNWNPSDRGNNPYKVNLQDYLNPQLLMRVVGCTNLVNNVSKKVLNFVQDKINAKLENLKENVKEKICTTIQRGTGVALGNIPNLTISGALVATMCKKNTENTSDKKTTKAVTKVGAEQEKQMTTTQCLDGIAITLAKDQLASMTRATMNWINTGFNGNPMYIRNINSFMNNITDKILVNEISTFKNPNGTYNTVDYPYARGISKDLVSAHSSKAAGVAGLNQNLTSYLEPGKTIGDFANNFSVGGWTGWLALTQRDANNPLGYSVRVINDINQEQEKKVAQIKQELTESGGILPQKICKVWAVNAVNGLKKVEKAQESNKRKCTKWEVVTPGSIIRDKISTEINSPERQAELVKTINGALSVLFSSLLKKFRLGGLASLGPDNSNTINPSFNFGSNSYTKPIDVFGNRTSTGGNFQTGGNFDLTKDLGNTYYHGRMREMKGGWNASTNTPQLFIGVGPKGPKGEILSDVYYIVTKDGDTKLFNYGYNSWGVGDRAFFNGTTWQNWKKGTSNPITHRGILQIQQDYIVATKDLLMHLPAIMPKIGELDYCIPGPNPNWQANTSDASDAFSSFINAISTSFNRGGFLTRNYTTIDAPSGKIYNTFKDIYNGTGLWPKITETSIYQAIKQLTSGNAAPNRHGKWKGNKNINAANDAVNNLKNKILTGLTSFPGIYNKKMNAVYGINSLMQKQFLSREDTPVQLPNPAWLQMSTDGLKITKNILAYNDEITKTAEDQREGIVEANLNIYKLKIIANKVSQIVEAAQKRRAEELRKLALTNSNIKVIAGEYIPKGSLVYIKGVNANGNPIIMKYNYSLKAKGISSAGTANATINDGDTGKMTNGTISNWAIPVQCTKEENLDYISNNDLLVDFGGSKENRCSDGIDNDLDGLIDAKDPDCSGYYSNKNNYNDLTQDGTCSTGEAVTGSQTETAPTEFPTACVLRKNKNTCLNLPNTVRFSKINGKLTYTQYECNWTDNKIDSGGGGGSDSFDNHIKKEQT